MILQLFLVTLLCIYLYKYIHTVYIHILICRSDIVITINTPAYNIIAMLICIILCY